nr:putative uncharacterized protein FLJ36797 [Pongo abelii]
MENCAKQVAKKARWPSSGPVHHARALRSAGRFQRLGALWGKTLPAARNLESFPLSRRCCSDTPPRPTGGDDVCSLVARTVPRLPLPFIDRSGRSDVSSRTFGKAAPAETAPTPAPANPPPPPGGGHEIKATRGGGCGDFCWSPRAAAPGVAMNGWMPARWDHQVRRDVAGARGAPPAWG